MFVELLAIQLLGSSTLGMNKSEVACKIDGLKNTMEISAPIDANGIGYISKDFNNYTFKALIAKQKINSLTIADAAADDGQNLDMINAGDAAIKYKDAKSGKEIRFSCHVKSPAAELAPKMAKSDSKNSENL